MEGRGGRLEGRKDGGEWKEGGWRRMEGGRGGRREEIEGREERGRGGRKGEGRKREEEGEERGREREMHNIISISRIIITWYKKLNLEAVVQ